MNKDSMRVEKTRGIFAVWGMLTLAQISCGLAQTVPSTLFEKLDPAITGIDARADIGKELRVRYRWLGSGIATGDVDGDGLPDVFVGNPDGPDRLYRQVSTWKFVDITAQAGVGGEGHTTAAVFVDIDGDSDLDLHVCRLDGPDRLYINDGSGVFTDEAAERGLAHPGASVGAAWMDYDRDGHLDVYLATHRLQPFNFDLVVPESGKVFTVNNVPVQFKDQFYVNARGDIVETGETDLLLRNNGEGRFENVLEEAGAYQGRWHSTMPLWLQGDRDAWPELYVGAFYGGRDFFFANNEGKMRLLTDHVLPYTSWFSLGADVGDLNNDGELDFFVGGTEPASRAEQILRGFSPADAREMAQGTPAQYAQNMLYINRGGNLGYTEVAAMAGVLQTGWSGGVLLEDFDLDGFEDIFIGNGMSVDARNLDRMNLARRVNELGREELGSEHEREAAGSLQDLLIEQNLAYANRGELQFDDVSKTWGLDLPSATIAAVATDLDRDGDVDLLLTTLDQGVVVYRNRAVENGSKKGLLLELRQTGENASALGAVATVKVAGQLPQTRQVSLNHGFMGAGESLLSFAGTEGAAEVEVRWPDGSRTTKSLATGTGRQRLVKAEQSPVEEKAAEPRTPLLQELDLQGQLPFRTPRLVEKAERPAEVLERLSIGRLGPATAVGDVNGDSLWDIYLGGDAGVEGVLLAGTAEGGFKVVETLGWMLDGLSEDSVAIFLDANGNGHADLLVASGGEEYEAQSRLLQNRLYWNDGKGNFEAASWKALPPSPSATSALAAADFDHDGDVDVFVGGGAVPGQFPRAEPSQLLRNDGGTFSDMTEVAAPDLANVGIVGGAVWTDFDGDGWVDLVVAEKWGSIRLFRNASGFLLEETEERGLSGTDGLWQGVVSGDFNEDGAMDFVVTNAGLNLPVTSAKGEVRVYRLGATTGAADSRMVMGQMTATGGETAVYGTVASLMQLAQDLPQRDDYGFWGRFGQQTLEEVVGGDHLEESRLGQAAIFQHSLFLNDGAGNFTRTALPRTAQMAPGYGGAALDVDGDGHLDVVLSQNYSGRSGSGATANTGLSIVLKGDGKGGFTAMDPAESGLALMESTRAIIPARFLDATSHPGPQLLTVPHQGPVRVLALAQKTGAGRHVGIRLRPLHKVPGARVIIQTSQREQILREATSQTPPELWLTLAENETITKISVKWADGQEKNYPAPQDEPILHLDYSSAEPDEE